ncbi:hypothetical protein HKD37_11G032091 [Glycine soja]
MPSSKDALKMHEMALRKLPSKRSRKDTTGEGSSAAPEVDTDFDRHRFQSAEHQQCFETIKGWSFLRERPQVLGATCDTHGKIRPEIVMEFYANAWPTEEGTRDMHSWVKGQWIPFDADTLSPFLGHPPILEEGQQCEFSQRRSQVSGAGFCPNPDREKGANHATSMTTLTQIWMTLLLSNILPSDHNSDLPLLKCQLVDGAYETPYGPEEVQQGPRVPRSDHGPLLVLQSVHRHQQEPSSRSTASLGRRRARHHSSLRRINKCAITTTRGGTVSKATNHKGQGRLNETFYRYILHQQSQDPGSFPWPTPEQFEATVAWHGDKTKFKT